jgi:hypothetical protein
MSLSEKFSKVTNEAKELVDNKRFEIGEHLRACDKLIQELHDAGLVVEIQWPLARSSGFSHTLIKAWLKADL